MVIYEVNLTINNDIFHDYYHWLIEHIEAMLRFRGFHKAEIAKEKSIDSADPDKTKLTVRYTLESEQDLNDYLKHQAPKLREDGLKKFGNKFSVFRRVFTDSAIMD